MLLPRADFLLVDFGFSRSEEGTFVRFLMLRDKASSLPSLSSFIKVPLDFPLPDESGLYYNFLFNSSISELVGYYCTTEFALLTLYN